MATKKETVKKQVIKKAPVKKKVVHISPELICAVLNGEFGPEGERNRKLTAAGYNPSAVTKKINDLKKLAAELKPIADKAGDYYGILLGLVLDQKAHK